MERALRPVDALLSTNFDRPRPVLYFQEADEPRAVLTANGTDNLYTTPNNTYVSGSRAGCYLGLPCWVN